MLIIELISYAFILIGGFLIITSAIGILRFPDFFSRLHAAGIGDSCGVLFILVGLMILNGFSALSAKILLLGIFINVISPTTTHILAKIAAYKSLKAQGHIIDE